MNGLDPPLPEGWKRVPTGSGKFFYLSESEVKIVTESQLESYHLKRRYLEMEVADLDFGTKARTKSMQLLAGKEDLLVRLS